MPSKLSTVLSTILTLCALLITALVVRREFFPAAPIRDRTEPVEVKDWQTLIDGDRRAGDREAPIQVVEFIDFQCSFCAQAAQRVDALLAQVPDRLAVVYRHYPMDEIHLHATEAAVAAECAADQGRFKAFHDALFSSQASIGIEAWSWFAERASLEDIDAFESCVAGGSPLERVLADLQMGQSVGVRGTPAFVIDGKLHAGVSGLDTLEALLRFDEP